MNPTPSPCNTSHSVPPKPEHSPQQHLRLSTRGCWGGNWHWDFFWVPLMLSPTAEPCAMRVSKRGTGGILVSPREYHTLPLPLQCQPCLHKHPGNNRNTWEVSKTVRPHEPQPDFLRMSLIFFFFCLPQAAAPAAQLDVPSVHRAASARGPPPPSAAAANRGPLAAHLGVMHIWGDQRRITLLCMLAVFFLYMCSDFFSVCHFDM